MKKLLALSLAAMFILASCDKIQSADVAEGDALPSFSVTMNNGVTVNETSFDSKAGFITFFSTSCSDCKAFLPVLEKVYKANPSITFCNISRAEKEDKIKSFWSEKSLTMPFSAQADRSVYNLFASSGIPRVYAVIKGKVAKVWSDKSLPTEDELNAYIKENMPTLVIDVE